MKLGHYCKDYIWQAALRIYANQPAYIKCENPNWHFHTFNQEKNVLVGVFSIHDCETLIFSKVSLRHYWILGEDARPEQMFRVNQITFMTGCWAAAGGRADYVFWLIAAVSASATEPRSVSSPQSSSHSPATHDTNSMMDGRLVCKGTFSKTSIVVGKIIFSHQYFINLWPSTVHFKATPTDWCY